MADLNYDISVNTKEAIASVNGLKTALGGLASAFAVREVVQFADSITTLRNKLIAITPNLDAVNKQFSAIAAIAISSRQPIEAVGDLYSKLQRSAKALGISQQEAADITDSLAKALSASGMSSKEAAGPLLQLGQALQSGTFQGDELRSILEGLPPVAQALADQLGVPVGALKKLGSEGQISADIFIAAMKKAKVSIDEAFGRTTPTITSALEGLKTISKVAFDEFEKNTQTGKNLAASIEYMAFSFWQLTKRIDEFSGTIATIAKWTAIILSFTVVGTVLKAFIGIIVSLGRAIWSIGQFFVGLNSGASKFGAYLATLNPFIAKFIQGMLNIGAAIAGSLIYDLIKWVKEGVVSISNFFDKMFSAGDATSKASEELKQFREELAKQKEGLDNSAGTSENAAYLAEELAKKLALVRLEMQAQVNGVERSLKQTQERLALENEFLAANLERINISEGEIAIAKLLTDIDIERRNAIASLNDQLAKANQEYANMRVKDSQAGKELKGRIGILEEQIAKTGALYDQHAVGMAKLTQANQNLKLLEDDRKRTQENIIKSIDDQINRNQKLGDQLKSINDKQKDIQFSISLRGKSPLERQIADIKETARKGAMEAGRAFSEGFNQEEGGLTPEKAQELAAGLNQIAQQYKAVADAQIAALGVSVEFADGQVSGIKAIQEQINSGLIGGWEEYKTKALDTAGQIKDSFNTFTQGMEDAFVKFVTTGKLSFSDLANSILADLARIAVKKAIIGVGSLFGFAEGGTPPVGQPVIVGEKGPELFVPKTAGTIIPNSAISNGSPAGNIGQTNVTYNIQAVDAASFRSLVARDPSFIYAVTERGRRSQPERRIS